MPFFLLHSHLTLILLHKSHLFCLHVRCQIRASYFTNSVCLTISVCSSRKVIIILEVTAGFPQIVFFHISLCHLTSHLHHSRHFLPVISLLLLPSPSYPLSCWYIPQLKSYSMLSLSLWCILCSPTLTILLVPIPEIEAPFPSIAFF